MLVVHGVLLDSDLLLWAEQSIEAGIEPGELHPFAADHATLQSLLNELVGPDARAAEPVEAHATLPTSSGQPRASSELVMPDAGDDGEPSTAPITLAPWRVPALRLHAATTLSLTTALGGDDVRGPVAGAVLAPDLRALAAIARHAGAAVLRQEFVPTLQLRPGSDPSTYEGRWSPLLQAAAQDSLRAAARALPTAALAFGIDAAPVQLPEPQRPVQRFIDALVDELVRARLADAPVELAASATASLHDRWMHALVDADATVAGPPDALARLVDEVATWQGRVRQASDSPFRICFRLEEPSDPTDDATDAGSVWFLRFLLQARDEPSIVVDLADAWKPQGSDASTLRRLGFHAGTHLFAPLGEAARLHEPIRESLRGRRPAGIELTTAGAHAFLTDGAPLLEQAGFGIFVPAWWQGRHGRFQLSLRAQVTTQLTGGRRTLDALNLETLVGYDWRLAIGDEELSEQELQQLAHQKVPLVHVRGRWVELDAAELQAALAHIDRLTADPLTPSRGSGGSATVAELVAMSVGATTGATPMPVSGVSADGDIADLLAALPLHDVPNQPAPPAGLKATLRPYQLRGFGWLAYMGQLGLGACLADDMGLGKTVQVLATVQHAREQGETGPTLIVCPTSVVTNWLRECERFTPELRVLVQHGAERATGSTFEAAAAGSDIVLTSYALLARDTARFGAVAWQRVVLDEAQNIKNPGTRHAVAARALRAPRRIALTGTPVENHVGDLWSIMEFLNPGLLGSQRTFRQRFLLPIQTGAAPEVTERLRQLTGPFLLRRTKTDRTVIDDLPDKFESVEHCSLTSEQVTLYEAIVRDAERIIKGPRIDGIDRRGMILATIAKLKQVCNHPAQLLGDNSRIDGRSGKLARLEELLEQVLDSDERALVFTQFVAMGTILQRQLRETFGREVLFLHGGTTRTQRDAMVARFQDPSTDAPPILVLSLKAGGSGLNLTAATHVVHYDRWWNPATEEQASDRAFRIGQTRDVQVHAFVCAGTVEEQVDRMLLQKRAVASSIVGTGERWITELGDDELLDLLQLRRDTVLQAGTLGHTGKKWLRASL